MTPKEKMTLPSGQVIELESLGTLNQAEFSKAVNDSAKELLGCSIHSNPHLIIEDYKRVITKHFTPPVQRFEKEVLDLIKVHHVIVCERDSLSSRVKELEQQLTEARKDTNRLQAVTLNLWSLNWNSRAGAWTVQKRDQTVGNIACDFSLREAITIAMKESK